MARLPILEYPDPRLRTRAAPVTRFDAGLKRHIADMFETMYAAPGIGLAATQVDWHHRLVVIDISENKDEPLVFINPEILEKSGKASGEEGCLSVPGIFDDVPRAERIRVRWHDADGKVLERELDGMLAVCVQHEMDHLEGKLFVDYLSELKRQRIRKKLDKERRERGEAGNADGARQGRS
jgi:peptide deformylase